MLYLVALVLLFLVLGAALFVKSKKPASSAPAAASAVVAPAPAPAQPDTGSDNPALRAYLASNPQHADTSGGENAPAVDTSGPVLDFAKIAGGVPVKLEGLSKRVENCPAKVRVAIFEVSSDPRARESYMGTVNGIAKAGGFAENVWDSVDAPEGVVQVSVDSFGYQFNIQAA